MKSGGKEIAALVALLEDLVARQIVGLFDGQLAGCVIDLFDQLFVDDRFDVDDQVHAFCPIKCSPSLHESGIHHPG